LIVTHAHRGFVCVPQARAAPCSCCGGARHPPSFQQDTLQQLHTQLKNSDALLNQNHGAIAAVLAELDPVQHSLGYLYLL